MKKTLVSIFILFLISCNSSAKKEIEALKKENDRLQTELESKKDEQNSDSKETEMTTSNEVDKTALKAEKGKEPIKKQTGYTFNNFHISENRVGIFSKGMTISDVYNAIPKEQIKRKVGYGEFADDTYDEYEIYDSNGKEIVLLTPKENGKTNSKINRILILDKRFKTTEKIGLNSTFGELSKVYTPYNIEPVMEHIIFGVDHISARFSINKTELQDGWWTGKRIDESKIPDDARFDTITIWWN